MHAAFLFSLGLLFAAAFVMAIGLPLWRKHSQSVIENAHGSKILVHEPTVTVSSATAIDLLLPVGKPGQAGLFNVDVQVHVSAADTQVVLKQSLYVVRQKGVPLDASQPYGGQTEISPLLTQHSTQASKYPPGPGTDMAITALHDQLYAVVSNPRGLPTTCTVFLTTQQSQL